MVETECGAKREKQGDYSGEHDGPDPDRDARSDAAEVGHAPGVVRSSVVFGMGSTSCCAES
ncbi:hypothetical protein GCM10009539_02560 [Cryptosporangium japonicum]|uniref:Uncharacterized protein n=1 Tax=Cryptosporangium japonicum TaxID=80872 RepID=A0ABP3D1K0_9ACTN